MRIAYVLGTFPSISETFILREILALRESGVDIEIFSLHRPDAGTTHEDARPLVDDVCYRPSVFSMASMSSQIYFLLRHPWRYFKCAAAVKLMYLARPVLLLKAMRDFFAAAFFAREAARRGVDHVHAHFAFIPADVAMVMAGLIGRQFSISAHAWDIYTQGRSVLLGKVRRASFVATCTQHGEAHLRKLFPELPADRIVTVRHGILPEKFRPRDSTTPMVLAVGRLEEKKGFRYLVEACGLLTKRGTTVHCSIVGNGPEASALRNTISSHALEDVVTLVGQLTQDEIMALYGKASVFVLPSVVASSGDRDGLANVIIEAMAMEIPVISTTASAASEAIDDGVNGFVIPPGDSAALADRIGELLHDEELRNKMGERGRERAMDRFDISRNVAELAALFQLNVRKSGQTTV